MFFFYYQDIDDTSFNFEEIKTEPTIEEVKTSHRGNVYRYWNSNSVPAPLTKYKKSTDKELMEVCKLLLFNMYII